MVIPKEIRRTMRIREGDPLEIYTDREGEVIFKKYSPIGELTSFAAQYAETLHKTCELDVVISDRDVVIACSGVPRKDYLEKRLSEDAEKIMQNRSLYAYRSGTEKIRVVVDAPEGSYASCIMPIIGAGDIIGLVAAMQPVETSSDAPELTQKLIATAANFLAKQLE